MTVRGCRRSTCMCFFSGLRIWKRYRCVHCHITMWRTIKHSSIPDNDKDKGYKPPPSAHNIFINACPSPPLFHSSVLYVPTKTCFNFHLNCPTSSLLHLNSIVLHSKNHPLSLVCVYPHSTLPFETYSSSSVQITFWLSLKNTFKCNFKDWKHKYALCIFSDITWAQYTKTKTNQNIIYLCVFF